MYRGLSLRFHQSTPYARVDPGNFDVSGYLHDMRLRRSNVRDLRMTGRLVALSDDETQYSMVIWYRGKGATKDVFSLTWRKPGGGEVQAVMKVVETRCLGQLQSDVRAACHERMTGMVPEQYGLYDNVEVSIQYPGMLVRRQPGYTVSLQLEADHGDDVAVAIQKLLLEDGQDCIRRALHLWRGAVEFIMEWQFREGGGRESRRYYYLLDVHPKNICALACVSDTFFEVSLLACGVLV